MNRASPRPADPRAIRLRWPLLLAAGVLAACATAPPLLAYTPPPSPSARDDKPVYPGEGFWVGPFLFSPHVQLSVSHDTNIFRVDDGSCAVTRREDRDGDGTFQLRCVEVLRPQPGSAATARASLALKLPFSQSYASLTYVPQYRQYAQFDTPQSLSHLATFETRLNFANGSVIRIRDEYARGYQDARRVDTTGQAQFATTAHTSHRPQLRYDWSFGGAWGVEGRIERADVAYEHAEVSDFSAFLGGSGGERGGIIDFFDYTTNSLDLRGYRNFSRLRLYAGVTAGRTVQDRSKFNESWCRQVRDLDRDGVPDDADGDGTADQPCPDPSLLDSETVNQGGLDIGLTGRIFPSTQADFTMSYVTWRFKEEETPSFNGVALSAKFNHTFNRRARASLSLERAPIQATGQVTGYFLREEASVGFERVLTMRLSTRVALSGRRYTHSGSDVGAVPFRFTDYAGDVHLRYRLSEENRRGPMEITLQYSPLLRVSSIETLEYDSHRLTLSASYGWF